MNYDDVDVSLLIEDKFYILKKYRKKVELIKGKCKEERRLQKYIDKYISKVDEVSFDLIEICKENLKLEKSIVSELIRRTECNRRNTTNERSNKVLEELLFRIQNNNQFQ